MILSADEVGRSLRGSWSIMRSPEEGLRAFDLSFGGFWRSFGAILLTAPAFVAGLAAARLEAGLGRGTPLFDDPGLVLGVALLHAVLFGGFPLAMIGVVRSLGIGDRYVAFTVAHNWSSVLVAGFVALPLALLAAGLATPSLAALYTLAFGVIVARMRFAVAKITLGISTGLAALLAATELAAAGLLVSLA